MRNPAVHFQKALGRKIVLPAVVLLAAAVFLAGCGTGTGGQAASPAGVIRAVGAENQYANVISQIGGRYVSVTAIMSNPNVDPHSYEADSRDAALVAAASLVVQNGLGYDGFMDKLEAASPNPDRTVIVASRVLGCPADTLNPHLWYDPRTMPVVAAAVARALESKMPGQARYFAGRLAAFDHSLAAWENDLAALRRDYAGSGVAVTEPVADYMLQAAGLDVKTPWGFQAAVMNGTDPAPQDVQIQEDLLRQGKVRVLVYNTQAVDEVTQALLKLAEDNHVPVVGVSETMPPGLTYQTWMEKEANDLWRALKYGTSTGVTS